MVTALYRRYRPESFAEVIGQEHVTEPLRQALRADRTNHAYLFSGPRGCGKTTSARILARCLNCAQGPTDTPCGVCESCVELARGGAGSMDVVEIDAASHGGVDDARDLRERAVIAPARDRFKVFIIDEAHMVTNQGFNALLKLVEEPPPHVKFVFATTEPDKVLATIRSRTHHYPFHLVPPGVLSDYLAKLCESEQVPVGHGVIPLVVRAGGGSVRDSLSVLDQLIAGAGEGGVDQARAAALLGFTESALLDDVVGAVLARDGATLFTVVDRALGSGQDPRRFCEDLLSRLRDLIVVQALGDQAESLLRGTPEDHLERLRQQASVAGAAELSRAAQVVSEGLGDMVGASSPRIQLELICARLILPGADPGEGGHGARLDRIERRLQAEPSAGQGPREPAPRPVQQLATSVTEGPAAPRLPGSGQPPVGGPASGMPTSGRPASSEAVSSEAVSGGPVRSAPADRPATDDPPPAPAAAPAQAPSGAVPAGAGSAGDHSEMVRRFWPDILNEVRLGSRTTWALVSANAQVAWCRDGVLALAFNHPGAQKVFAKQANHAELLARAVLAICQLRVVVQVDGEGTPAGAAPPVSAQAPHAGRAPHAAPAPTRTASSPPDPAPSQSSTSGEKGRGAVSGTVAAEPPGWGTPPPADEPPFPDPQEYGSPAEPAHSAESPRVRAMREAAASQQEQAVVEDEPSRDDADAEDAGQVGAPVVERLLGGKVIDEA